MSKRLKRGVIVTDTAVIGAGFAGLSTAYHLAKKGLRDIVVIEHEKKLGGHASGRNAGMIRQAIADPILGKLACQGRRLLHQCEKKDWEGVKLVAAFGQHPGRAGCFFAKFLWAFFFVF